jgi:hypothetical protein
MHIQFNEHMPDTLCELVIDPGITQYLNGETQVLACWSNGPLNGVQLLRADGSVILASCSGTRGGYLLSVEEAQQCLRPAGYQVSAYDVLTKQRAQSLVKKVPVRTAMEKFLLSVEADVHRVVYARTGVSPVDHAAAPVIVAARLRAGYLVPDVEIPPAQRTQLLEALNTLTAIYNSIVSVEEPVRVDSLYDTLSNL